MPSDVAVAPDRRELVLLRRDPAVDPAWPAVIVLWPEGRWLATWGEAVQDGHMLAVAQDGRVWVTDQAPRLSLLATDGALLGRCRPALNGAHGMALAADGTVLRSEESPPRVTRLVPLG